MVEFIASNAYRRLNELSVGSIKINAAVCYWTMPPSELSPDFLLALSGKDSCLVVDIHSPTSIDSLAKLNLAGANIFLYMFQIVGKTEVADSKGIPDHLMHAKVFVFDYGTNQIKIWVGSHNGTRRAMLGLNFEFASVITCDRNSDIHLKALRFINGIKNISSVFQQSEIDLYKTIQGGTTANAFIELQDSGSTPLVSRSFISIFGTRDTDYEQMQKVGKLLYLSITNTSSGVEAVYKASVEQTGYLDKKSKPSLKLGARRYAVKDIAGIPNLETHQAIPASTYTRCRYFVTLKVDGLVTDRVAVETPDGNFWCDVDKELYLQTVQQPISEEASAVAENREFGKFRTQTAQQHISNKASAVWENHEIGKFRIQGVNLGQAASIFESEPISDNQRLLRVLNLKERKALPIHPLIRKRMLVPKVVTESEADSDSAERS